MEDTSLNPSKVRQGRFLWMAEPARKDYLRALREKISAGYYTGEPILAQIADSLSPMYAETVSD
ncbi:MAG: hypothetical protein MUF22_07740 [Chitinispirillaceae bacterium]|jgi:hypothetical protein|nr:hypothetical protein [Chitinispirillaceae bacterium]